MDNQTEIFVKFIETVIEELNLHRQVAFELECNESTLNTFDKVIALSDTLEKIAVPGNIKINYLNQFKANIEQIRQYLSFRGQKDSSFVATQNEPWKIQQKNAIEASSLQILNQYNQLEFNLDFFNKIGFFSSNVVAVGANGSGKTSLSNKFKTYLQNNGVVISAQRILLVPNFDSISNPITTATQLKQSQQRDKTNKNNNEFGHLQQEFGLVLKNLLAENIASGNDYRKQSLELVKQGKKIKEPSSTNLDKTFQIWNSLIEHRTIDCKDGMNITAESDDGRGYPAIQMSDGEKVMLYLIGQVLQAPENSFIVVDEPEMYLHKTILKKLWDILEKERQDCLFIYLTHDLDFATSRTTAKKIWIKSFTHPDKWEIEDIPENEIPETLLFELLGSRKNILFCEGVKGSIDERIYSIIFPDFTVTPVSSCFDVINHTKAFNKIPDITTKAYGLIDSDHHGSKRLKSLIKDNVFSFDVTEAENLFLDEKFLSLLAKTIMSEKGVIKKIKTDTISEFNKFKELQSSNYVSTRINYYFKDSHVSKGNKLVDVKSNYDTFKKEIKIDDWYNERIKIIEEIVTKKDYSKAISIFNHKGLQHIASKHLKITDFIDRSIKLIQFDSKCHKYLYAYFPDKLIKAGNTVYSK